MKAVKKGAVKRRKSAVGEGLVAAFVVEAKGFAAPTPKKSVAFSVSRPAKVGLPLAATKSKTGRLKTFSERLLTTSVPGGEPVAKPVPVSKHNPVLQSSASFTKAELDAILGKLDSREEIEEHAQRTVDAFDKEWGTAPDKPTEFVFHRKSG
ncbi:hypothetical protein [Mesorhizobium sp. M0013]|uniref:hypothetical protein n=1 Tax=Mesorhizobium sp. M0013 TaxID=2956841 RepID=UPI0033356C34